MSSNFLTNSSKLNSEAISHSVRLFLTSEENKLNLRESIASVIHSKITFFGLLINTSFLSASYMFQKSKRLVKKMILLENKLIRLYE